jgi:hypothetical protein
MPENASKHTAIRQVPIPLAAPPYDDEPDGNDGSFTRGPTQARGTTGAGHPPAGAAQGGPGSGRPPDPDPRGWGSRFAQILAETLAGSRPARQLTPWTTEQARRQIRQLGPLLATGQRPRVRRVMTSAPASGVLELTAVVGFGPRVRVLALRLERDDAGTGRWCCTAIDSA